MAKYRYNSWPSGQLPEKWRRPEPEQLRSSGFLWTDPRDINDEFSRRIADRTGAPFVVLTDCCTNAIFLTLSFLLERGDLLPGSLVTIPRQTYVSIPMVLHNLGLKVALDDREWSGEYELGSTAVFDSAARMTTDMFLGSAKAQCLSFQIKKILPIGRGGAILTGDKELYEWARLASYDGRDLTTPYDSASHIRSLGWHMYMTPEDAARGCLLLDELPKVSEDSMNWNNYPPLDRWDVIRAIISDDEKKVDS